MTVIEKKETMQSMLVLVTKNGKTMMLELTKLVKIKSLAAGPSLLTQPELEKKSLTYFLLLPSEWANI